MDAPLVEPLLQRVGPLLAVDTGHLQAQPFLAQDRPGDAGDPVHARVGAAGAARADDQRDARAGRGAQQDPQVAGDGRGGRLRRARAQVIGARVGGAGVEGDHVGPELDPAVDGLRRESRPPSIPLGARTLIASVLVMMSFL
ncbi:hypothetical protein GCM10020001_003630 [Nonomuraea salmonea]